MDQWVTGLTVELGYHWLKDADDWSAREVDLHWLRHSGLKTARAWRLKERLRDILAWRRLPQVPVLSSSAVGAVKH